MKKALSVLIVLALLCVCTACGNTAAPSDSTDTTTTTAATTTTTASTEATVDYTAFCGLYKTDSDVNEPSYNVQILNADNTARSADVVVSYYGKNGSPIYETDTVTVTFDENNTATFAWEDSWSNKGEGTLKLDPADTSSIQVMMTVTEEAEVNRATLSTHGDYMALTRR